MNKVFYSSLLSLSMTVSFLTWAHTPPNTARVEITTPKSGEILKSPFVIKFGLHGYKVVPAGERTSVRHKGGHHHLLIDTPLPDLDEPIPVADNMLHFDRGETKTKLDLQPGTYTLQLLLGDEDHEPHDPPLYSKPITIKVE